VPTYSYTLTEHNPEKPWLIVSVRRQMEIDLPDVHSFWDWAHQVWPTKRFTVQLDPGQLL
jgi:hypothetical protein